MLPVSLDCPFFIAPSEFSNVSLTPQFFYRGACTKPEKLRSSIPLIKANFRTNRLEKLYSMNTFKIVIALYERMSFIYKTKCCMSLYAIRYKSLNYTVIKGPSS